MASYNTLGGLQDLWERLDPFGWNAAARAEREAKDLAIQADYAANTAELESAGAEYAARKSLSDLERGTSLKNKKSVVIREQEEILALSAAIGVPLAIGILLLNK
jgi:hypothetical protein